MKSDLSGYYTYGNVKIKLNNSSSISSNVTQPRSKSRRTASKENDFAAKIITDHVNKTISLYNKEVDQELDSTYSTIVEISKQRKKAIGQRGTDTLGSQIHNHKLVSDFELGRLDAYGSRSEDRYHGKQNSPLTALHESFYLGGLSKNHQITDSSDHEDSEKIRSLYSDKILLATLISEAHPLQNSRTKSPLKSRSISPSNKKFSPNSSKTNLSFSRINNFETPTKPRATNDKPRATNNKSKAKIKTVSPLNRIDSSEPRQLRSSENVVNKESKKSYDLFLRRTFDGFSICKLKNQGPRSEAKSRPSLINDELKEVISQRKFFDFLVGYEASKQIWVDELAAVLIQQTKTDLEKAFIAYLWVCMNIEFDVENHASSDPNLPYSALVRNTIKKRIADSRGFAYLFQMLCKEMGIVAEVVKGLSKTGSLDRKLGLKTVEHYWNLVKLAGEFFLIDCTWGAGYVEDGKFIQALEIGYFLTHPQYFAFRHFPQNPDFQFLEPKMTLEEFETAVFVGDGFSKYRLDLNFPINYIQEVKDVAMFEFTCPNNVCMIATVQKLGQTTKKIPNSAISTRKGNEVKLITTFQKPGEYILEIFLKRREAKKYSTALRYRINAKVSDISRANKLLIPRVYALFYDLDASVVEPLANNFKNNDKVVFKLGFNQLQSLESVALIHGPEGIWLYFNKRADGFWELKVSKIQKPVHIAVKLGESKSYEDVLTYD